MKYYINTIFSFLVLLGIFYKIIPVKADLPLQGKVIVVDAGHGGLDPGTTYKDIYEKDITLAISLYLEKHLSELGATVVLTRSSDADLSNGVTNHRKRADFDNRIKIINNKYTDMYVSIHLNYLSNSKYYGAQVFYNKENKILAKSIQEYLNENTNTDREIKKIPSSTYMYDKLKSKGVLIECGFLSNASERTKLITESYQEEMAKTIARAIAKYYS